MPKKKRKLSKKEKAKRRKRIKLPLPDDLKAMPSVGTDTPDTEDRSLHQGRKRTFAHEKGCYPTHVYISVSIPSTSRTSHYIRSTIAGLRTHSSESAVIHDSAEPGASTSSSSSCSVEEGSLCSQYHISLSRTVPVRQLQIDAMVDALSKTLTQHDRFSLRFNGTKVFHNDDRSRSFVSLLINEQPERDALVALISDVDKVFKQYRHEAYYENPEPHMTFAWSTSPIPDDLYKSKLASTSSSDAGSESKSALSPSACSESDTAPPAQLGPEVVAHEIPSDLEIAQVDSVIAKFGNRVYTFQLK